MLDGSLARLEHAKALAALGTALRRARRPADAREPLRRALELAAACGAPALADHVRTELLRRRARARAATRWRAWPRSPPPSAASPTSPRRARPTATSPRRST